MPCSKSNKKRPGPNPEDVEAAVKHVIKNNVSIRSAAKLYNVSKSPLARIIKEVKSSGGDIENYKYKPKYESHLIFNEQEERELTEYIKHSARLHYGLTTKGIRELAYKYAKLNGKIYPKEWDKEQTAGEGWLRCFRQRHGHEIALRKPEATSIARATSFTKENVDKFFAVYKEVLGRHNFSPSKIFNVDETRISTVHTPPRILAEKGQKQLGAVTAGERGPNITMIACINAIGNSVPPLFVFPRINFVESTMMRGAPLGSIGAAHQSGWSNEHIFLKFLNHFISHVKPTAEDPVILLLDNHESHMAIAVIDRAKEAGVILVTFNPHTTHKMQPLDRTVFGPFKTFYNKAAHDFLITPGPNGNKRSMTIYDVAAVAEKAYKQSFTPANIVKGFEVCGLFPLNTNIFPDHEFVAACAYADKSSRNFRK